MPKTKATKNDKKEPAGPTVAQRLAAVESALTATFGINFEEFDTTRVREAREKANAEAAERAKKSGEPVVPEPVEMTEEERIARIEQSVSAALGISV